MWFVVASEQYQKMAYQTWEQRGRSNVGEQKTKMKILNQKIVPSKNQKDILEEIGKIIIFVSREMSIESVLKCIVADSDLVIFRQSKNREDTSVKIEKYKLKTDSFQRKLILSKLENQPNL